MPFNRIQNPILQDRLHSLLGIKGAGSSAPTLAAEVQPVVIIGDVGDETIRSRQRRWVQGTVATTAVAGQLFMNGGLFNPSTSNFRIKLASCRICMRTGVAGSNEFGCAFDDLNPQTGGTARETHRESPEVVVGRLVTYTTAGVIPNVFQRRVELGTGGLADVLFTFNDLVLQPAQGITFSNITTVGIVAGNILDFNFEWREDEG